MEEKILGELKRVYEEILRISIKNRDQIDSNFRLIKEIRIKQEMIDSAINKRLAAIELKLIDGGKNGIHTNKK